MPCVCSADRLDSTSPKVTASDHLLISFFSPVITSPIIGFTTIFILKAINQRLAPLFVTSSLVKKNVLSNIWKLSPLSRLLFSSEVLDLLSTVVWDRLYFPLTLSKCSPSSLSTLNVSLQISPTFSSGFKSLSYYFGFTRISRILSLS